jgi:folate-binding protein YgfZ
MIIDQSRWGILRVTGGDRVRFIQGMCTANIEALAEGQWARASMCNVKGRIRSIFDAVQRGDHLLLICEPQLAVSTREELEKFAIADDVTIEPVDIAVYRMWDTPQAVWNAPPVFGPLPGPAAEVEDYEVRRIEGGFPKYGVDVTDDNFPFETPLGKLIDYGKGCYIGQEPIARVQSRGAAQKTLRGLRALGDAKLPVGAKVSHPQRDSAGEVTSSAMSPRFGAIALAYVHRLAWEPGTVVQVADRPATVVDLPLC